MRRRKGNEQGQAMLFEGESIDRSSIWPAQPYNRGIAFSHRLARAETAGCGGRGLWRFDLGVFADLDQHGRDVVGRAPLDRRGDQRFTLFFQ